MLGSGDRASEAPHSLSCRRWTVAIASLDRPHSHSIGSASGKSRLLDTTRTEGMTCRVQVSNTPFTGVGLQWGHYLSAGHSHAHGRGERRCRRQCPLRAPQATVGAIGGAGQGVYRTDGVPLQALAPSPPYLGRKTNFSPTQTFVSNAELMAETAGDVGMAIASLPWETTACRQDQKQVSQSHQRVPPVAFPSP